jgi:hypothetical protein
MCGAASRHPVRMIHRLVALREKSGRGSKLQPSAEGGSRIRLHTLSRCGEMNDRDDVIATRRQGDTRVASPPAIGESPGAVKCAAAEIRLIGWAL